MIPYVLYWEQGRRVLEEAETLRSAGIRDSDVVVLKLEELRKEPEKGKRSLRIVWQTERLVLRLRDGRVLTLSLPMDMPCKAIVDNLRAENKLELPLLDPDGRKLVYRLRWDEKARLREDKETLREVGVPLGDSISLTAEV